MLKVFKLPDLGEGLTESEIVAWKVAVGDTVALNQVIAEVETAKAVVELPSPYAGTIAALHEGPGTVVEVGKPIVSFEVPDDGGPRDGGGGAPPAARDEARREPNLVGYGAAVEKSGRPARRRRGGQADAAVPAPVPAAVVPATPAASVSPSASGVSADAERPRSTPPVRKLARDLGVDLLDVVGTGPSGLIGRADVHAAAAAAAAPGSPAPAPSAPETSAPGPTAARTLGGAPRVVRTPIRGVRKHTAAAMVASAFTAPHATEFLTIDVTPTMELLARLRAHRAFAGIKLTPLTIVAKAVCVALERTPALNSRWDEAAGEIAQLNYVNLGIAAATPRGLTVPNIKDAQSLDLAGLGRALAGLAETARAGRTTPADLAGGTISITNIGVFGIDAGTPILNPGEAAILAVGQVRRMPWEYRDEVALRQVMTLSLSFDHRLVDGEQGSRFLADVGTILADPGMLLAMV
ncbi:dihydrolipoamide acetyltransferase family protein [Arthrobacter halodurans]|uniref:Dihydrolipoamide acetyltransferase component of pyruvate dehydrogenase complex n=1 Tax=Arthrobacter halodurans TaxID=516699 RepID=A0ABV4UQF9_9MICC